MSKVRITNKLIINSVVDVIYQMHPYHNPEGINKIVQKIKWMKIVFFASMRKNTVLWNRQNVNNVKIVFVTQK